VVSVSSRERGAAVVEVLLVVGLVLIPFGVLVVTVPVWIERQHAAQEAAAEAARAIVTATGPDVRDARLVVALVAEAHGLAADDLSVEIDDDPSPGGYVTVRVTVVIPPADLPGLGALPAARWTAQHTERRPDLGAWP
jgi:hypothetical protein